MFIGFSPKRSEGEMCLSVSDTLLRTRPMPGTSRQPPLPHLGLQHHNDYKMAIQTTLSSPEVGGPWKLWPVPPASSRNKDPSVAELLSKTFLTCDLCHVKSFIAIPVYSWWLQFVSGDFFSPRYACRPSASWWQRTLAVHGATAIFCPFYCPLVCSPSRHFGAERKTGGQSQHTHFSSWVTSDNTRSNLACPWRKFKQLWCLFKHSDHGVNF